LLKKKKKEAFQHQFSTELKTWFLNRIFKILFKNTHIKLIVLKSIKMTTFQIGFLWRWFKIVFLKFVHYYLTWW